jgi:DNA polymerase III gamma/tau subunit
MKPEPSAQLAIAETYSELYKKHRPCLLKDVVGQDEAVRGLKVFVDKKKIPHCIMFVGPSGCGKTTLARILQKKVECSDSDFVEVNAADFKGIEMVRDIRARMGLAPIGGKTRCWLIDECHKLTNDAQNAMLKMLEDTPSHVYFFLATTDPQKLLSTIKTRATQIKVKMLSNTVMETLIKSVAVKEKAKLPDSVVDRIVEYSEGSARQGLVLLNQVIDVTGEQEQLSVLESSDLKRQAIDLARKLLNPRCRWNEITPILKDLDDDPESVRYLVLSYMSSVMLSGSKITARAAQVADVFQHNFYDTKKAGLVLACYACCAN